MEVPSTFSLTDTEDLNKRKIKAKQNFFNLDSLHARLNSHYEAWSYKKKKHKISINSRLKITKIIGQRKGFYRQRIREHSCATKESVDIDILVTSRNGDRKFMQSIKITSRSPSRKGKWNQFSQF